MILRISRTNPRHTLNFYTVSESISSIENACKFQACTCIRAIRPGISSCMKCTKATNIRISWISIPIIGQTTIENETLRQATMTVKIPAPGTLSRIGKSIPRRAVKKRPPVAVMFNCSINSIRYNWTLHNYNDLRKLEKFYTITKLKGWIPKIFLIFEGKKLTKHE